MSQASSDLVERLAAALEARGPDYAARTHHKDANGRPRFTNRLILETSPYLLQHAHNPVNWFPWGDEAFARARRQGKPVFLSVGYSTCHWCHVMERESFEDLEIAQYMNEHFVCIKVDREERPDVDDIYMRAVQTMTGRGGWPMSVMLTDDRQPFFGGTYFPARDGDRGSRHGFLTVLRQTSGLYANDRARVVEQAQELSTHIASMAQPAAPGDIHGPELLATVARTLVRSFDPEWGGFGGAPKFPQPSRLMLLLRYYRRTSDAGVLRTVVETLDHMAQGGIYDHVGGGFHRYATDPRWLVPHFEKMLYDNAQLAVTYLEAYQVTGHGRFARVVRETLDYVAREMTNGAGAFYSATDADSLTPEGHDEEGYFFTWTPDEVRAVLGDERASRVHTHYGVTRRGNFEGRTILHTWKPLEESAREVGMPPEALLADLRASLDELRAARELRPAPIRDDKVLAAWNGLMISAFAQAGRVLDEARYVDQARRAATFILEHMKSEEGRLSRSYMDGQPRHNAYLDDYAFLIASLLDLYEASGERRWLTEAVALQGVQNEQYMGESGAYFMTSDDHEALLSRDVPSYDGAVPSGNSVALMNLLRLGELTGDGLASERAQRLLAAFSAHLGRGGMSLGRMLLGLDFFLDRALEVVIVGERGDPVREALLARHRAIYLPNAVLVAVAPGALADHQGLVPLLEGKVAIDGTATAYVCERGRCELPTSDPTVFARQLSRVSPLADPAPAPVVVPQGR